MTNNILIKNPSFCITAGNRSDISSFSKGHIYIENNKIKSIGPEPSDHQADIEIDGSRMLVLPGLINTHHHFFQTLTRNIFCTQQSPLFDWLLTNYEIWREIDEEGFFVSAKLAIGELLKSGCTTTSDHLYLFPGKTSKELIDSEIKAATEAGIRFQPTRGSMSLGKSKGGLPPDDVIQSEQIITADIIRLLKKYHDDSVGSMTRISLAPCSPFSVTSGLMKKTVALAKEYNLNIHTHLAETIDEENFCLKQFGVRPFQYLKDLGWIRSNAWFAHSIFLNQEEINELGDKGAGISHCPTSNMRLGSGIAPIKEMLSKNVKVSLGVDGSASNDSSNMLNELRNSMLLSRLRKHSQWLSAEEIFYMATKGGAEVLGRDDIGTLEVGKQADLIMISLDRLEFSGAKHDPLGAVIFSLPAQPVDYVIVNGKIVVKEGNLVNIDEADLLRRHSAISTNILQRVEKKTNLKLFR